MIFNIFLFLFALSLVLIIGGFALDIPLFNIIGSILLIGMGGLVIGDDVTIKVGENISEFYEYGDNYNSYHYDGYNESAPKQLDELNVFHIETETIYTYEPYEFGSIGGTSIGWIFLVFGIGMFVISLTTLGE